MFFLNNENVQKNKKDAHFFLNRKIALWCCRDLRPFSIVEDTGFNDFWNFLKRPEKLPVRKTISVSALDDAYECMLNRLIDELKNCPNTGYMTFDAWTDNHRRLSYITYTYHFINDNWELKSTVLKTTFLSHPHTGFRLMENFRAMLKQYKLESKTIGLVTDDGPNMKRCCELLNFQRASCYAHRCNLLIQTDLLGNKDKDPDIEKLTDVIKKMKRIQQALVYKYDELKRMFEHEKQDRIFAMLSEMVATRNILEADERFTDYNDDLNNIDNNDNVEEPLKDHETLKGGSSMNPIRWGCIQKLASYHLEYQSIIYFFYMFLCLCFTFFFFYQVSFGVVSKKMVFTT